MRDKHLKSGFKTAKTIHILLVEPNEKVADKSCSLFESQGKRYNYKCKIDRARSGISALNLLYPRKRLPVQKENIPESELLPSRTKKTYNILIVSPNILDISWRSVVEKVRRRGNSRFIYVISDSTDAYHNTALAKDVQKYGGNGIYRKPINKTAISNILMNIGKYN